MYHRITTNLDLRETARKAGVYWWQIAEYLEISEPTLTRRLRHELPEEEKKMYLRIIEELRTGNR